MNSKSWAACGVVTLTTDFGLHDPFVGIMKGRILDRLPTARIVDLTHDVHPYWPVEAGFWLSRSAQYFPTGTVHLAVVDPGVGSERNSLILKVKNHLFLAPDNGLLTAVWERNRADASAWRLDLGRLQGLDIRALSATFHGRDLYAPLAAVLASGVRSPEDLGEPTGNFVLTSAAGPVVESGRVAGIVITIDHFGNLITNIEADLLLEYQSVSVLFEGIVLALKRTYSDGQPGELISVVNSFGVIEIAQVQGNAALTLGATRGTRVEVLGQVRT